ncbi:MAG: dynamin family protein [Rhodocyclaceae bacterium]
MDIATRFTAYSAWRTELSANILRLRRWLHDNEIADAQMDLRLDRLVERLREDKLQVAFVAEFSRGKSELINAIFFADFGQRILPSSAGRTTMCPTELLYEAGRPPQIELLPIVTRARNASIADFKRYPEEWQTVPLDTTSADAMHATLAKVGEQKSVSREEAESLGFAIDDTGESGLKPDAEGRVTIPAWRHAIINFPHPLLKQGLVILDTPGLNAIGAEPELTLSLLPNAHAVLFILAADTGVTQSDLAVWREHIGGSRSKGRIVVLNKIDGLWDGLRTDAHIEGEIAKQVASVADTLEISTSHIFPVSAQKGLVAKINCDTELLDRSLLPRLEQALMAELIPSKQEIVGDGIRREVVDIFLRTGELLDSRLRHLREQLQELTDLRGKNQGVIEYMMRKVKVEKEEFDSGLQQYYAVRSVFSALTNKLYEHLGMDAIRDETRRTRERMLDAKFSKGLRDAMSDFFRHVRDKLGRSRAESEEITRMLEAMYKRFSVEHGLKLSAPVPFSVLKYEKEMDRLQDAFHQHVNTLINIMTLEKRALTQKFFETIAVTARRTFESANRDVEVWLRAVMAPLETQVREYQLQLKRRLESVKRIHQATDTLEERIRELTLMDGALTGQQAELSRLGADFREALQPQARDILAAA